MSLPRSSPPAMPSAPSAPRCITSNTPVLLEHGDLVHVSCPSQALELAVMEETARTRASPSEAFRLPAEVRRRRADLKQAARQIGRTKRRRATRTQRPNRPA
jgi:hypothetical protein